jgi:short-subunit dehydrogenase
MCVREQMQQAKSTVQIVELFPPPVQTELHDVTMGEEKGRQFGMPADEFAKQAYDGLVAGLPQVIIGSIGDKQVFSDVVDNRMKLFDGLSVMMRAH